MTTKSVEFVQKFIDTMSALATRAKHGGKPLVHDMVNIPGDGIVDYNLQTLFPDYAQWDMTSCRITCLLLDDQVGSDTENYYINAESTLVAGIKANGAVRVRLHRVAAADVIIRIDRPTKKLP